MTHHKIIIGDCVEAMKTLPDNSVDSVVTDPPYELGFMGKHWDKKGIAYNVEMWSEVYRLLKPGGHLLSFGGTRTYHRMASAVEDAGFEIRDMIPWIYGSGFPKSLNISKAIDKKGGVKRRVVGKELIDVGIQKGSMHAGRSSRIEERDITVATAPEAIQWNGWGTALKPAVEPIVVARKPLGEKTVAENVLKYGTGGINVDGCRIEGTPKPCIGTGWASQNKRNIERGYRPHNYYEDQDGFEYTPSSQGRFPANIILDEVAAEMLDGQSGELKTGAMNSIAKGGQYAVYGKQYERRVKNPASSGGASRFFYVAKASAKERWFVCRVCGDAYNDRSKHEAHSMHCDDCGVDYAPQYDTRIASDGIERAVGGICQQQGGANARPAHFVDIHKDHNTKSNLIGHPTQKPFKLTEYLVKLVTPPNGVVLDQFLGTGTLTEAARNGGFNSIGVDEDGTWEPVWRRRLKISEQLTDDTTYEIITGS